MIIHKGGKMDNNTNKNLPSNLNNPELKDIDNILAKFKDSEPANFDLIGFSQLYNKPINNGGEQTNGHEQPKSKKPTQKEREVDEEQIIKDFLYKNNYRYFDKRVVKIEPNGVVVDFVDIDDVNPFIFQNIKNLNLTTINGRSPCLTNKNLTTLLTPLKGEFLTDPPDKVRLFIDKFYLEIDSKYITKIDYKPDTGYVWKKQIININSDLLLKEFNNNDKISIEDIKPNVMDYSNYYNLCSFACSNPETNEVDEKRFRILQQALGYVIHKYKDDAFAKALFFTEVNELNVGSEGRAGKSLICKGLKLVRNVVTIDTTRTTNICLGEWTKQPTLFLLTRLKETLILRITTIVLRGILKYTKNTNRLKH